MKTKKLWLVVFAALMCLSVCLVGCSKKYTEPVALRITNKTELRTEWFEGGADRTLELQAPPELSEKDIRVMSSDPSVIAAEGKTLKAKGAGIAKITVAADDESDSVTITVKSAPSEIAITNKSALEKIVVGESKTLEYAVKPELFDADGANVEIVSSDTGVISVSGNTVTSVAQGTATVTVTTFGFTDTVEISAIALSAPELGDVTEVKGTANTDIALPVTAYACDGTDLREHVTAVCPSGITFDKNTMTVKAAQKGDYSVTLTVADPRDTSLTDTLTLTVKVFRNIFANVNGYGMVDLSAVSYEDGKQFVEDAEQTVFFDRWDGTWAAFDVAPGKTYYSEFIISSTGKPDWSTFYGMTHSVKTDDSRYLTAYVDRGAAVDRDPEYAGEEDRYNKGARAFRVKDIDFANDSNCWELHQGNKPRNQVIYSDGLYKFRGIDKLESFPCKLATVRMGDFFYFFVNDDYVCTVTNEYFSGKDTVPGYFQQSGIKTDISNIVWLTGDAAEAKFASLTANGSKLMSEYAPNGWWDGANSAKEHMSSSADENKGANYAFDTDTLADENSGIVTPYIFFDGNFTFEWEYAFAADTAAGSGNDWNKYMGLEVRHAHDDTDSWSANYGNSPAFLFGATRYDGTNGKVCAMVKPMSVSKPNYWDAETPTLVESSNDWYGSDGDMKLKFSVTRICTADENNKPTARYTFTISKPDGTQKNVWTYVDRGALNWKSPCEPVILLWKNREVKGEYTNVKWSVPEKTLEISNKTALTARWAAGDAARTVELDLATSKRATLRSSDPSVIRADGRALTPLKAGTATITATASGMTDSVTITVIPALSSITITDKAELTAAWKIDADEPSRTLTFALDPAEHYTAQNTLVTVTSSDPSVIRIDDGATLVRVGLGKATITVSAGGKTDTCEIAVTSDEPTLTLAGGVTEIFGMTGEIALPALTALSTDGDDISADVEITCDSGATYDRTANKLTANASGTYTVSYALGSEKSITLSVHVYRKIFAESSDKITYVEDKNNLTGSGQKADIAEGFEYFLPLDMTAGKNYYAEVTFTGASDATASNEYLFGMTHSVKGENGRFLAMFYDRGGDGTFKVKNVDKSETDWGNIDQRTSSTAVMFRENVKSVLGTGETGVFPVKFGVARMGDMFYCFVNGKYVMGFTDKYFGDKDTVAGVFVGAAVGDYKNNLAVSTIATTVTDISFNTYADGAANAAFDTVSQNGKAIIGKYAPNSGWNSDSTYGNVTADYTATGSYGQLGYTYNSSSESGNNGLVSPNIFFDGDFTVEWEYEWKGGDAGNWDASKVMSFEVRGIYRDTDSPWQCKLSDNTTLQFGAQRVNDGGDASHKLFSYYLRPDKNANDSLGGTGKWYGAKMKFKVQRVCDIQNNTSTYTLTMSSDTGENPVGFTLTVAASDANAEQGRVVMNGERPCDPVAVYWRNTRQQGEYTNIKWSASATQAANG